MALEQIQHIEGLEGAFQASEGLDDTDPGAMIVRFEVVSEEMPAETERAGHVVRKNFVHIYKQWEVGHTAFRRRIRDSVEFDETEKKWKVKKLAPESRSDILKHPAEWNAFARGTAAEDIGTPLSVMFKHDPSRVLFYKDHHITTVERLSGVNDTDASLMGFGVGDDVRKARDYLARLQRASNNGVQIMSQLDSLAEENARLKQQIEELASRKEEPVEAEVKRGRGRPKKIVVDDGAFQP